MDKKPLSRKMTRKSAGRISDELAALDARTRYLTPIFGSEASDVAMPDKKINRKPIEPRIASEMIQGQNVLI